MNKIFMAMIVVLSSVLTACGTTSKTDTYVQPQVQTRNLSATEIEISPATPSTNWKDTTYTHIRYGAKTEIKLQDGFFLPTQVGKEYSTTDPKTHQTVVTAIQSSTDEVIEPESPGTNGTFGITFYSTQPHVYLSARYTLDLSYAISVITPALAKELPMFVYPSQVDVAADRSLRDRIQHYITADDSPYAAYVTSVSTFDEGGQTIFKFKYRDTPAQLDTVRTDVHSILQKIIKPGMDTYEKEFAIHNWIATHVQYDSSSNDVNDSDYTALTSGKSACAGITALTYQMLSAAGINSRMVTGDVHTATYQQYGKTITEIATPGAHIWNEVQLDGTWYYLDVTGDLSGSNHGRVGYYFFNLTSSELGNTHTWDSANLAVADTNFLSLIKRSSNPQDQAISREIN